MRTAAKHLVWHAAPPRPWHLMHRSPVRLVLVLVALCMAMAACRGDETAKGSAPNAFPASTPNAATPSTGLDTTAPGQQGDAGAGAAQATAALGTAAPSPGQGIQVPNLLNPEVAAAHSAGAAQGDPAQGKTAAFAPVELPPTEEALGALRIVATQIDVLSKRLAERGDIEGLRVQLVDQHLTRAQYAGQINDYETALAEAEKQVKLNPKSATGYLLRAEVLNRIKRFSDTMRDIGRARSLGAPESAIRPLEAEALLGRGDAKQALPLLQKQAQDKPTPTALLALAVALGELGQYQEAETMFRKTLEVFKSINDPLPFIPVGLCYEWGRMYERAGDTAKAIYLYNLAYERMPLYPEPVSGLAMLLADAGAPAEGAKILRTLVTTVNDPSYLGYLAALETALGNTEQVKTYKERTTSTFNDLLKTMPELFAAPAARYFAGIGGDPKRALTLAKNALKERRAADTYALAASVAIAAGQAQEACVHAQAITTLEHAPMVALEAALKAFEACGKQDRVAEINKKLSAAPSRPHKAAPGGTPGAVPQPGPGAPAPAK